MRPPSVKTSPSTRPWGPRWALPPSTITWPATWPVTSTEPFRAATSARASPATTTSRPTPTIWRRATLPASRYSASRRAEEERRTDGGGCWMADGCDSAAEGALVGAPEGMLEGVPEGGGAAPESGPAPEAEPGTAGGAWALVDPAPGGAPGTAPAALGKPPLGELGAAPGGAPGTARTAASPSRPRLP